MKVSFIFGNEARELEVEQSLAETLELLQEVFEEGPLSLVYEYGKGKRLAIKQDDEFQAALITWPGCPKIQFKVILEALAVGDFTELCLHRFKYKDASKLKGLDEAIQDKFERAGTCMITAMKDCAGMTLEHGIFHTLGVIMKMRQLTHPILRKCRATIVKSEGEKSFMVFENVEDAVVAGILMMNALDDYNAGVPESRKIQISIGCDIGKVLMIPHDLYGDCVNVASKLGEDTAEPGEFFVTKEVYSKVEGDPKYRGISFEAKSVKKSGVVIPYVSISGRLADERALEDFFEDDDDGGFSLAHRESPFSKLCRQRLAHDEDADVGLIDDQIQQKYEQPAVVFCSDMSGFTRTVKKRGILHFLSLIMMMRKMVQPILEKYGGTVIKTEADNFYVIFSNEDDAVAASLEAQAACAKFNKGRAEDDLIMMKIGLDTGTVLNATDDGDIYGTTRNRSEELGEELGEPGEVLISEEMKGKLRKKYKFGEMKETEEGETFKYCTVRHA